jgi:DUF4097 and DUF4098 domain-containing protein YvlB
MMRKTAWMGLIVAAAVVAAGAQTAPQNANDRVTVPFSDPSRPGTVTVKLISGGMTVRGADRRDVSIESAPLTDRERSRTTNDANASGLRRLTSPTGLVVEEENNQMSVRTSSVNSRTNLDIVVPTRTNLKLSAVNGGEIVVEGVQGEIETNNVNGSIALTNVSGSVVAHSTNGKVVATLRQVTTDTPMAFTSLNGNVDVTVPPATKANLRLRTDNGDVFTDFDIQVRPNTGTPVVRDSRQNGGRYRIEVDKSIYGTINGGGPEFELRTFNGNVYLRKGSQ